MTFRSPNRKTELEGVRYVQGVVQNANSIFQAFALENDQGNDCYIEFVINNRATNAGVFVQIKSGKSYKDSKGYKIPADKWHLKYWSAQLYPTIGIVYDPELNKAFWVSITHYLKNNPEVQTKNYHAIRVPYKQEFSEATFPSFVEFFISYIETFKGFENFGQSLDMFANVGNYHVCYEGLKTLYSNHRDKISTWFYVISNFGEIHDERIRRMILGLLSNYIDNPYVFWHTKNMQYYPSTEMQKHIANLLTLHFGIRELKLSLPYLREGILIGDFSYLVFRVIAMIKNVHVIIKKLAFEPELDCDERNNIFWLYLHIAKYHSKEDTLYIANEYLKAYPCGYEDEAIIGTIESIRKGELLPLGQP